MLVAMTENQARLEICRVGKSLFERGYVHATAGNISVRLGGEAGEQGFIMTPTDACLGFLQADQLSKLDAQGQHISGAPPSKTLALHRAIYAATGAQCIIHTHSTHCVALTMGDSLPAELIPAITPYFVIKVGRVPVMPYRRPGHPAMAQMIAETIAAYQSRGTQLKAVMLPRLGPNVWANTPAAAMAILEELEETAQLWFTVAPKPTPLNATQLGELRATFNAIW